MVAFVVATTLLVLAISESGLVLVFLSRAIARRNYRRIGPEPVLRAHLNQLQAYYEGRGFTIDEQDTELVKDVRQVLLDSYTTMTPSNRGLNQLRYRLRSLASSHLVRSLIWALGATTVIFSADKLGFLPKVTP
jgi:hypothetical protein